jgi:DNA-binding NarL/FixJ family response regulator
MREVGATILIVDDYAPFRSSARLLLDGDRFRVVGEAVDGASALDAAQALLPDVVLLDVQLPDMDGFEVARRLGAQPHAPQVVLTSSRDAADFPSRLAGASARGFISKADLSQARLANLLEVGL